MIDSETLEACWTEFAYGGSAAETLDAVLAALTDHGYTVAKLEQAGWARRSIDPNPPANWFPFLLKAEKDHGPGEWVPVWRIVEEEQ